MVLFLPESPSATPEYPLALISVGGFFIFRGINRQRDLELHQASGGTALTSSFYSRNYAAIAAVGMGWLPPLRPHGEGTEGVR